MKNWPWNRASHPILPALLTPFGENGKINESALEDMVEKVISEGVDGIFACGSTAEVFLMSKKERKRALEVIMKVVDERIPVIAHVGSPSPIEAIKLGEHAAKLGVAAISAVPPFYYKYTPDELRAFYFKLADETDRQVLLYSIAIYTGINFTMTQHGELLSDSRILGLKHTNQNLYELNQIKRMCPDKLVLMGHEEVMLGALALGADGAIGATFNDIAPLAIKLRDLFLENRMEEALAIQNKISAYCDALSVAGVGRGIKYSLSLKGFDVGHPREPYAPIDEAGLRAMEDAIANTIM